MNAPCYRLILVSYLISLLLSGCASFNSNYLPDLQNKQGNDSLRHVKMVYVQEGQKPQDNGELCYEFHGCLWHGKNTFGAVLSQKFFDDLGVKNQFLGLSRMQRAYTRTPTIDAVNKGTLGPDEYVVDARVRYISDGAGSWFLKSLVGGLSFTMLPIWQTITMDVDLTLTDHNQEVVWKNRYTDSYTSVVWFLMFPMISTASSTPDEITDKIARTAINDMVKSGVFGR